MGDVGIFRLRGKNKSLTGFSGQGRSMTCYHPDSVPRLPERPSVTLQKAVTGNGVSRRALLDFRPAAPGRAYTVLPLSAFSIHGLSDNGADRLFPITACNDFTINRAIVPCRTGFVKRLQAGPFLLYHGIAALTEQGQGPVKVFRLDQNVVRIKGGNGEDPNAVRC